jgi:hypothetical protein
MHSNVAALQRDGNWEEERDGAMSHCGIKKEPTSFKEVGSVKLSGLRR